MKNPLAGQLQLMFFSLFLNRRCKSWICLYKFSIFCHNAITFSCRFHRIIIKKSIKNNEKSIRLPSGQSQIGPTLLFHMFRIQNCCQLCKSLHLISHLLIYLIIFKFYLFIYYKCLI
jgi:hypothetical protein